MVNALRILLAIVAVFLVSIQPLNAQEEEDFEWVSGHFKSALDQFMPLEKEGELSYRSYRDLYTEISEYSFVFSRNWQEKRVDVTIRQPEKVSLYDQIMKLHRENPSESIESIKTKVKVREIKLNSNACPSIETSFDEFEALSLKVLSLKERADRKKGIINEYLHPTIHTFVANVSDGNLRLDIRGKEHPFAIWALRTRTALEKCVARK